jgi:hypothetical protein
MIDDLRLRLVITAVFSISIAVCLYVLVAQRDRWKSTVSNLLHLVMSVAMIVMAWSGGMDLPRTEPAVFFLLAAIWFLGLVATIPSGIRERLTNGYHAVMMTGMAWMFAVMGGGLLVSQPGHLHDREMPTSEVRASGMHTSSAMDMLSTDASSKAHEPVWITTVNWIATIGFAAASLYWLFRFVAERRTNPVPKHALLIDRGLLCQASLAAGMAIMFGAMG